MEDYIPGYLEEPDFEKLDTAERWLKFLQFKGSTGYEGEHEACPVCKGFSPTYCEHEVQYSRNALKELEQEDPEESKYEQKFWQEQLEFFTDRGGHKPDCPLDKFIKETFDE